MTVPGSEPTLGEIGRTLVLLRDDTADIRRQLEKLDGTYVRRDVYEEANRNRDARIADLEATHVWLIRTVGGLVLTATGAVLVAFRVVGM
jgi:hypothetical protein